MNSKRAFPPGHENEVEQRRRLEQNLIEYFELDHSANFVQSWGRLTPFLSAESEYRYYIFIDHPRIPALMLEMRLTKAGQWYVHSKVF